MTKVYKMDKSQISEIIKEKLKNDKIQDALRILMRFLESKPEISELIIQSARFERINNLIRKGVINWKQANLEKNQIIISILEIIDSLKNADSTNNNHIDIDKNFEKLSNSLNQMQIKQKIIVLPARIFLTLFVFFIIFGVGIYIGEVNLFSKNLKNYFVNPLSSNYVNNSDKDFRVFLGEQNVGAIIKFLRENGIEGEYEVGLASLLGLNVLEVGTLSVYLNKDNDSELEILIVHFNNKEGAKSLYQSYGDKEAILYGNIVILFRFNGDSLYESKALQLINKELV